MVFNYQTNHMTLVGFAKANHLSFISQAYFFGAFNYGDVKMISARTCYFFL